MRWETGLAIFVAPIIRELWQTVQAKRADGTLSFARVIVPLLGRERGRATGDLREPLRCFPASLPHEDLREPVAVGDTASRRGSH
jgi:hypothetical protein